MFVRRAKATILAQLARSAAVVILGPRQVGKTTLAREIAKDWKSGSIYLDLERPSDFAKLRDPETYLTQHAGKLVILDEIQRFPELFPILRSLIDDARNSGNRFGQFLLLGSASLDLVQGASESLAGRVSYIDLGVLTIDEIAKTQTQEKLWLCGGFPESLLAASEKDSFIWREDFISSYLERDIPNLGPRVPAETLRRFWTMIAHLQGQIVDKSKIASNLGVSPPTITRYMDLLVDLLLIRPLRPWSGNVGKRLVKRPKFYIRDSGLVHALLRIQSMEDLLGHPVVGKSWEGFVIENLLAVAPRQAIPFFYETNSAAEIELVLEITPKHRIAIDMKRSLTPVLSKGFYNACTAMRIKEKYVVYPGQEGFPYSKDVQVVTLGQMMEIIKHL